MRGILVLLVIIVLVAIVAIALGFVNVSQTRTGSLPAVHVSGGSAPAFDVQTANVSVGSENKVVAVPTVNVQKPQ